MKLSNRKQIKNLAKKLEKKVVEEIDEKVEEECKELVETGLINGLQLEVKKKFSKKKHNIKNHKDKNMREKNITLVGWLISTIASFILIAFMLIKFCANLTEIGNFIMDIFITLSAAVVPVGIINIVYGYFDSLKHAEEYINNAIFSNKSYLKFNEEQLKEIKDNITNELLYKDIESGENSLLAVVQQEIEPLVQKAYIKEREININCFIENDRIVKKVHERILYSRPKLKNNNEENKLKLNYEDFLKLAKFDCSDSSIGCESCNNKCYTIEKLMINDLDVTKKVKLTTIDNKESKIPDYKKQMQYEIQDFDNKFSPDVLIELEYETRVVKNDIVFVHKIEMPCKDYTITFNYDKNVMNVIPCGFGFMDFDNNLGKRYIIKKYDSNAKIHFKNWILPGDGVCFAIDLKK